WRPNLQTMKIKLEGKEVKVKGSTKTMKTLKGKNGDQVKKILLENKDNLSSKLAKILFSAN
uniref:large ribosomal subunit protein bL28 n=1 Tax=Streptobacillus moniliformis TaxID=34105 RepID=UPI0007E40021